LAEGEQLGSNILHVALGVGVWDSCRYSSGIGLP